jgi:hypothetical protein
MLMGMGFRTTLIVLGIALILGSFYLGDWTIWLGGPIMFMGFILKYLERGS